MTISLRTLVTLAVVSSAACGGSTSDTSSSSIASGSSSAANTSSAGSGGASASAASGSGGSTSTSMTADLVLSSGAFKDGGELPAEYTCDGVGHSPALAWTGAPAGTAEFVLLMTTLAKDGLKWNWVLYGIPSDVTKLDVGQTSVGTFGLTSDGPNLAYSPPCSQGPGAKDYTFTLYALSGKPTLPSDPKQVTGAVVTAAIEKLTLAKSAVTVSYTRP